MYLIIQESVDESGNKGRPIVVEATFETISVASRLLESVVRGFLKEQCGSQVANEMKIIDIKNLNQVNEPLTDTMLVYRLEADPHTFYIFQRKTKVVNGTLWGQSTATEFRKVQVFTLVEFTKLSPTKKENYDENGENAIEYVRVGPAKIKIPKPFTVAPMVDLIAELKKSPIFLSRQQTI